MLSARQQFQNILQISYVYLLSFDRKVSSIFFTHFITKCKSTSLSIECCRRLIAWLVKLIKEWASRLPAISLNEKIPRHSQLFSWEKKTNLKEKWDAKVCIFCSLTAAPAVFVYILQAKSSASASFILTEEDLFNELSFVRTDNRLKYRAICCSINQLVLDNISSRCRLLNSIFGKPHKRRLAY